MQTTLSSARCGTKGVITAVDDHLPAAKTLRRLGIHEGMPVEVLHGDDPVIILCHRSKIAVSRRSLDAVTVSVQNRACGCYFLAAFFDLFRFKKGNGGVSPPSVTATDADTHLNSPTQRRRDAAATLKKSP